MGELRDVMEGARREAPEDGEALERLVRLRNRRRRNGRVLSGLVALVATGGVATGLVVLANHTGAGTQPGPGASGPTANGGQESGPSLVAEPGQYYYWKFVYVLNDGHADIAEWYGTDGSGRVEASATTDSFGIPPSRTFGPGESPFAGEDLSGLSTDPAVLADQLRHRNSAGGASPQPEVTPEPGQGADTGGMVRAVEDLVAFEAPNATPGLRAALYEVLRGLPTAQDLDAVADPAGRPAVAVRIVTEGSSRTFYFDASTRQFMAESWQSPEPGSSPLGYLVVQAGGIVDDTSATPSADRQFFPAADDVPDSSGPGAESTSG